MVKLFIFIWHLTFGMAFQLPFAEQNVPSAASTDDCECQSGALEGPAETWNLHQLASATHHQWSLGHRFGPHKHLVIGSTNPGGLRSKEALAVAQGPGIWTYSETQLSAFTQVSSGKALQHAARQTNRLLRTHF